LENPAYGYNACQDGGYWHYMSLGAAQTLWRRHGEEAIEWVANAHTEVTTGDENHPYERIDGKGCERAPPLQPLRRLSFQRLRDRSAGRR
jgi:hypothetical protein